MKLSNKAKALAKIIIMLTAKDLLEIKAVLDDDIEQESHHLKFYALGHYCGYVDTHGTDHGLSRAMGVRMEKRLTLEALKRVLEVE